jgi:type IV pilus assembly protein PilW
MLRTSNDWRISARRSTGVSLIELMVAITIALLLTLGLIQIFGATRTSSQMQDGLSRVQENGRFATQFLQRQLRMVGFMGCGSDTGRITQAGFVNHFALYGGDVPDGSPYRFQRSIEAFTAGSMAAPSELPASLDIIDGTDVLILRTLSEDSVPVLGISKTGTVLSVQIGTPDTPFLPADGEQAILAMQNCRSVDVFAGTVTGSTIEIDGAASPNIYLDPTVTDCGAAACPWDYRISNAFLTAKPIVGPSRLNAEMHRMEYIALYVAPSSTTGIPGLHMLRLKREGVDLSSPEELVEGVENMQLRFGYDENQPSVGAIGSYRTAAEIAAMGATEADVDQAWRGVLSVRVALLVRSPDRATIGSTEDGSDRTYRLIDTDVTADPPGFMREVYETTIALRNRLFNS